MAYSLSFSKSILILVYISDKTRRGETRFLSAKMMSEKLNIPKPTLSVIFKDLIRAGILVSKEGVYGGVRLARKPKEITLLDLLVALENEKPLFQTDFQLNVKGERPDSVKRSVSEHLKRVEGGMREELRNVTLQDVMGTK